MSYSIRVIAVIFFLRKQRSIIRNIRVRGTVGTRQILGLRDDCRLRKGPWGKFAVRWTLCDNFVNKHWIFSFLGFSLDSISFNSIKFAFSYQTLKKFVNRLFSRCLVKPFEAVARSSLHYNAPNISQSFGEIFYKFLSSAFKFEFKSTASEPECRTVVL